jgi:hypothetical protein
LTKEKVDKIIDECSKGIPSGQANGARNN